MLFTLTPSAPVNGYGEALLPLADAKAWLRVDGTDEDALIEALRDAAIDMIEQLANVRLGPVNGLVAKFAAFGERMRVGVGPAATLAVTGIAYLDSDGTGQTIAAGGWRVDPAGGLLPSPGTSWPCSASAVAVTFSAGYPAGAAPAALIQAARMFLAHLYLNREAVVMDGVGGEVPLGVTTIVARYRMPVL